MCSLDELGDLCPNLEQLFLTMVHCHYSRTEGTEGVENMKSSERKRFSNLHTLSVKGSFSLEEVQAKLMVDH